MPDRRPEVSAANVVFLGSFNPAIFQPSWFARQNLISTAEADSARLEVVHPQVSHFETESYVIHVQTERFMASAKPNSPDVLVRDLVLGAFYVLEHTPVTAMGINRTMHFGIESEGAWHHIGDKLAPKGGWSGILGGRPGMLTLEILAARSDNAQVPFRVKVQPSIKVRPGVYFETNEHYAAPDSDGLKTLLETLRERFENAQQYAERTANYILDWASSSAGT